MDSTRTQLSRDASDMDGKSVLLVGYRSQITAVLDRLAIPYAVWHDKPIKAVLPCDRLHIQGFPRTAKDVRQIATEQFAGGSPFTHVIAGSEAAVYPASVCRRTLDTRKSKDSIALRCSDKIEMKLFMQSKDIPMTDFLRHTPALTSASVYEQLGPTVVIKHPRSSGGRGIYIAQEEAEIGPRMQRGVIYERFVDAKEMSVETFVRNGQIQFTSTTNYAVKKHVNIVPANVDDEVRSQVLALNKRVVDALKLNWGLTHAEYYWSTDGILFGEVALRPPGGYIMECISLAHQFDAWEAFVANELNVPYAYPEQCKSCAGVAMLHAGQGVVTSVENVEAVRALPSCVRCKVLVKPGDHVQPRAGVSEISAYGLFLSDSAEVTERDTLHCLESIRFQMQRG